MLEYLLKVSFVLAIGYLFYKLVLQQESFFATNRVYMICCLALAFTLPLVTLPRLVQHQGFLSSIFAGPASPVKEETTSFPFHSSATSEARMMEEDVKPAGPPPSTGLSHYPSTPQNQANGSVQKLNDLPLSDKAAESEPWSWMTWLALFYGFGVAVFALNLLFQIISIFWRVFKTTDRIEDGDYVIVNTDKPQAPCSFFKYIFLHPDSYDFDTYEQIVSHEKIHVRQGHTYDLLLVELAVVVLWFNPLVWLFKKEVEKNIEYQTDAILLEKEQVHPSHYQMSLLQIACPNKPLSITTNYNQSLLKQRICMMNAKKSTSHAFWKYSFLAPLFFGTLLLLNEPATSQNLLVTTFTEDAPSEPNAPALPSPEDMEDRFSNEQDREDVLDAPSEKESQNKVADSSLADRIRQEVREKVVNNTINTLGRSTDMSQGLWYGHTTANEYCIDLRGSRNTSSWNISRCFDKKLFTKKEESVYVMTKEAGTLQLNGNLDEEVSQGKYTFTPDPAYIDFLAKQDVNTTSTSQNLLFFLFLGNVDKNYISYLKSNYQEVSGQRLEELAIHGISLEEYKGYMALFQKHDNRKPSMTEVLEAKIHGISQEYVQEIQAMGYQDLPMKKMMEAKIHNVNTAYVAGLRKAGFDNLPIDKVIEAKIHRVSPEYIQEVKALGYGDQSLNKIIELKIHGVNAAYIQELKAAGFDNLTLSKITEAKIHRVNAQSIKEILSLGYKNLSLDKIIQMKIHRVNADFLNDLKTAGFANIGVDKAIEAKIHGVNGDFIKKARQEGYNLKTLDEYIRVKIMGMGKRAQLD